MDNSLINLGDLSKPVTVLIEKIANATGILYEPTRIRRAACAHADAQKIKTLAEIEISDIQQRALTRVLKEEGLKQQNIEKITTDAFLQLKEEAKPNEVENDWISFFFDKCRNVSDAEMQSLWSNLLAGEANQPGKFRKRTIELVSTLEKKEAHLFTRLCQFSVSNENYTLPLIFDYTNKIYTTKEITQGALSHLDSIGLIRLSEFENGYELKQQEPGAVYRYFESPNLFHFDSYREYNAGYVVLTQTGQELASICGAKMDKEILDYLLCEAQIRSIQTSIQKTTNT